MATESFAGSVSVNLDWGVKNLEQALDDAKDLSFMYGEYKPFRKATKADIDRFVEEYKECKSGAFQEP